MRRVIVHQPRPDCLEIHEGRAWSTAAAALAGIVALAGVLAAVPGALGWWALAWCVALGALPVLAVHFTRALRTRDRAVVRTPGRLLLDGEPLELARVELRVTHWPLTKVPTGCALSLWVMTATGPEDISLGHFNSMFAAAPLSGQLEEFVQRAGTKAPSNPSKSGERR